MMHPNDPLREEPEGWDDHMTADPPGGPEHPRPRSAEGRTEVMRAMIAVACFYGVAVLIGIAVAIAFVRIWS